MHKLSWLLGIWHSRPLRNEQSIKAAACPLSQVPIIGSQFAQISRSHLHEKWTAAKMLAHGAIWGLRNHRRLIKSSTSIWAAIHLISNCCSNFTRGCFVWCLDAINAGVAVNSAVFWPAYGTPYHKLRYRLMNAQGYASPFDSVRNSVHLIIINFSLDAQNFNKVATKINFNWIRNSEVFDIFISKIILFVLLLL